jgi:hypothetical protein
VNISTRVDMKAKSVTRSVFQVVLGFPFSTTMDGSDVTKIQLDVRKNLKMIIINNSMFEDNIDPTKENDKGPGKFDSIRFQCICVGPDLVPKTTLA